MLRHKSLLGLGLSMLIALSGVLDTAYANVVCDRQSCLWAHDVNGIRLDMTMQEVSRLFSNHLTSLGGGNFKGERKGVTYSLGFTPLGHLFRIDSSQDLGRFVPDLKFASDLTAKLADKYGPPETNQLPGGPAFWSFLNYYEMSAGWRLPRQTESLSVGLGGGYGLPVTLDFKLMDFRILRRDAAIINRVPELQAQERAQF